MYRLLSSLILAGALYGQFGEPAARIIRGSGAPPAGGCLTAADVGKVYYRSDTAAPGASSFGCSQTGVSVYSWESLGSGSAGGGLADPGSNGHVVRTALGTTSSNTFAAGCGLAITNADGTGGNTSYASSRVVSLKTAGYAIVNGDCGTLLSFNSGSSLAVTLPQAGASSLFISGWLACVNNIGAGTTTITPTTSTIDGHATLVLTDGSTTTKGTCIHSNGTNYYTTGLAGAGSSGGGSSSGTSFQRGDGSGGFSSSNLSQDADGSITPSKAQNYSTPTACSLASTTLTCDYSLSNIWAFTITANWTLAVTNSHPGVVWILATQDGTGGWTLACPASFLNCSTLDPIAGDITVQVCAYDGTHYLCAPAASTEVSGTIRLPARTAPVLAPGANKGVCWLDSGNLTLNCYSGTGTTTVYTVPKTTTSTASQFFTALAADGTFSKAQPAFTDISGVATGAQLPNPAASTLGGVQSKDCSSGGQLIQKINTDGTVTCATPGSAVITGTGNAVVLPFGRASYNLAGSTVALRDVYCYQFSPSQSIAAVTVSWKNGALATGSAKWGLFPDSSGAPDFPNGFATAAATLSVNGVFFSALSSTYTINSGTSYWICTTADTIGYNWFGSGATDTDILAQPSHLRSIKCGNASTGSGASIAFPASCGSQNTGTSGLPYVAILP